MSITTETTETNECGFEQQSLLRFRLFSAEFSANLKLGVKFDLEYFVTDDESQYESMCTR